MLRRIRSSITTDTANRMYKSFIIPLLDYCDTVWNYCGKLNSDSLEKFQRQAARIIAKQSSSDDAMNYLAYQPLELRRREHVYNLVKICKRR